MLLYCYMYIFVMGGGESARGRWGVSEDPASDFYVRFGNRRAIQRGGGDKGTPTPSPQAAITIDHPSRMLLSQYYVFLECTALSIVLRALWAGGARSN